MAGHKTNRLSKLFMPANDSNSALSPSDASLSAHNRIVSAGTNMANKLTKHAHGRGSSVSLAPPSADSLPPRPSSSYSSDLLPPPPPIRDGAFGNSYSAPSSPRSSRPSTPTLSVTDHSKPLTPTTPSGAHGKVKRKSWLPGLSKDSSKSNKEGGVRAWVAGYDSRLAYDLNLLLNAHPVPELWNENGDTFIYLFPATSGRGPSFRIDSALYAASPVLTRLAHGKLYSDPASTQSIDPATRTASLGVPSLNTPPMTPEQRAFDSATVSSDSSRDTRTMMSSLELAPRETHLYIPLTLSTDSAHPSGDGIPIPHSPEDIETLIAVRNLFGFLVGQSLIATESCSSVFSVFLRVADMLKGYQFSNLDGSTFGEVASSSFDNYIEELNLADMRDSREKTIEGIVLGERMRSVLLYNEAFVHAAGKYDDIMRLDSPKFDLISSITRTRLERAHLDLEGRQRALNSRLQDFEFPEIFSGIMNSKTSDARKEVNFAAWRESFMATRKHIMAYYKRKYGSWPPKASSKKNTLETSGLNRLVVRDLCQDFACLYDMMVDRKSLTYRTIGAPVEDPDSLGDPHIRALRLVLDEFDRSTPPIQPPMPFDVPLLPDLSVTRPEYGKDEKKDAKLRGKKLKDKEIDSLLRACYNQDANVRTPFLDDFKDLELKAAHSGNFEDLRNHRIGQWIFLYAVLQSLPMLVVDAPSIRYTQGVEYFLCEPPRSGVPWILSEDSTVQRHWYSLGNGGAVVSLPSDVIEFGVEGVFKRSHCWTAAQAWAAQLDPLAAASNPLTDALPPPPGFRPDANHRRSGSPSSLASLSKRQSMVMLNLEALPMPAGVSVASAAGSTELRPVSRNGPELDPKKTFDAILGGLDGQQQNGKDKKKKK